LGNKSYFVGDITIVDFLMYERLDVTNLMIPGKLDQYPKLKGFKLRMDNLLANYKKTPRYIERPVNGSSAVWK